MIKSLLRVLGFLCLTACAADLPPLVLTEGMGVNIHFVRGHTRDLDMIRDAGFRFIRMDFGWHATEFKRGEYSWADYDELTANLEKRGIRPLYILDYSNPLYEQAMASTNPISHKATFETASPQHPESVAAFARWAAAAAAHYKGRRVIWEIWNEPNIFFWKPKPNAEQYATLALATAKAIRAADPDASIIGPASSGFPWEFLEIFLKSGVLDYLDGVSVHPYRSRNKSPETAVADFARLRVLIKKYAPPDSKRKWPIISGEWGYSSHRMNVSTEAQAAFLVRQQLSNLLDGIPLSIWYDWKNDGEDPDENEQNFGTVSYNLEPKPVYHAAQTLSRQLAGYSIARRIHAGATNDFVLALTKPGAPAKLAAWTQGEPHSIVLEPALHLHKARAVSIDGKPADFSATGETVSLRIERAPIYVTEE
ncbi:MAG TPA: cellulase family glycosylhydrolase [Candidatus Acidoferrum sp.]|nr:cellulase family glycosylhydrolase [Candidatus Acidoferrum sp.]